MLFNSLQYILLFLPLTVLLYFIFNTRSAIAATTFLVLASLFFYAYWKPVYLVLLLTSITFNYYTSKLIIGSAKKRAKTIMVVGVIANLALLAYFKYADFFLQNLNLVSGTEFKSLDILLPLAVSFFTFQQIAYLVDCYKNQAKTYNFSIYALFVGFFPQLIAGPIVHHKEMMPQFMDPTNRVHDWENIAIGYFLFSLGLFKKLFVADTFAVWATAGFANSEGITFFPAWGASLSYSLQLYYDFSGYCDMAIGSALMFNIRLPINFNSPYKALDIQDFWRRWHITLSRWLRDYLYIPLGGNRKSTLNTYFNIFMTFLIGGLWHGAGWNFIIWGALHGGALIVHRFWQHLGFKLTNFYALTITLLFVNFTWVFFRAEDFNIASNMLQGMSGANGMPVSLGFARSWNYIIDIAAFKLIPSGTSMPLPFTTIIYLITFGWMALKMPNSMELTGFIKYSGKWRFQPTQKYAILSSLAVVICISLLAANRYSEFIYFNF